MHTSQLHDLKCVRLYGPPNSTSDFGKVGSDSCEDDQDWLQPVYKVDSVDADSFSEILSEQIQ